MGIYDASGALQSNLAPAGGTNLRDTVKVGTDTWISSFSTSNIVVFDSGGTETGTINSPPTPFGMQLAPNGDVWVVDQNSREVRRITPAGAQAFSFDADDGPNGPISSLWHLGVAADGTLFIPNQGSTYVDVYSDTGSHLYTLTHDTLDEPRGILPTGSVFEPPATPPIPTLSNWAIFLLALALGLTAVGLMRKRARFAD